MATKANGKQVSQSKKTVSVQPVDKKLWPLYIIRVLRKHAHEGAERDDEGNHYLTRKQIVEFLEEDYGICTQIKAVGDNLTRLYDATFEDPAFGFRLEYLEGERNAARGSSSNDEKQLLRRGWRLIETDDFDSDFVPSEIRLLVDSVIASAVITPKHAEDLIKKLCRLSPDEIVLPDTTREGYLPAENPDFLWNIEMLNEAIEQHKRVEFFLGRFGQDGKLHNPSRGRAARHHRVVPMQLLISKGHYYLLAHYRGNNKVYKFRIDLMLELEIEKDSSEDVSESNVNVVRFREQHSYMMSGKILNVTLRIDKRRLHTLYDQFGTKVHFKNDQEDTVDVELKSSLYSVLFWALQYYRSVEVLSPPELREALADAGQTIHEMYVNAPGTIELGDRQSADESINGKEDPS